MLGGIDIRIATTHAKFGVMEPKRGLFAGGGTTVRLPRQLAFPAAMEFLLTAEAFPAERALELGSAQRDRRAEDELLDRAQRLGAPHHRQRARSPCRPPRRACCGAWPPTMREAYKIESELSSMVFASEDAKEGPKAFAEKRDPALAGAVVAVDPRTPCVIGVAQFVSRPDDGPRPSRWRCGSGVVRAAAADAPGVGRRAAARSTACRSSTA